MAIMASSDESARHKRSRDQFAQTAAAYVTSPWHAKGSDLSLMVELAGPLTGKSVLDVATGAGHVALAFAREGARVVAVDLTSEMLRVAAEFTARELEGGAAHTIEFKQAPAEALPVADATFDYVTCRIAAHHFADARGFVHECARVLKPGAPLLLIDNIAPQDAELAALMNDIERERDPSHVCAYDVATWVGWLAAAGLELHYLARWRVSKVFRAWLARANTPPARAERIRRRIGALSDARKAYFEVDMKAGRLESLSHEAALFKALKPA